MAKIVKLEELYATKGYVKGNISYGTPEQLVGEMIADLNKISPDIEIRVDREEANQNKDETKNISYGRVLIEMKPQNLPNGLMIPKIGLLYALDTSKPIMKVYTGAKVTACTNLAIFQSDSIFEMDMLVRDYQVRMKDKVKMYCENIEKTYGKIIEKGHQLNNRKITKKEFTDITGKIAMMVFEKKNVGVQTFNYAMEAMCNSSSKYYVGEETTGWNIYNALTQHVTDKISFADAPDKSLAIGEMIDAIVLN